MLIHTENEDPHQVASSSIEDFTRAVGKVLSR